MPKFRGIWFTSRQWEILQLLLDGLTTPEISRRFDLAEPTVYAHVSRMCAKVGVLRRMQLVVWALGGKAA